jgi:hypothetical protein
VVLNSATKMAAIFAALCACAESAPTPADLILELPDDECSIGQPGCMYSFGAVSVGQSTSRAFLLWNLGLQPATIARLQLTGDPAFSLQQGLDGRLPGADARPIVIAFEPFGVMPFEAELSIASDVPEGQITVRLAGHGLLPEQDFSANGCDFGEVPVGTTATGCFVYIGNSTARGVAVFSVRANAPFSPQIDGVGPFPVEIPPGQTVAFPISATPTALGTITGAITIDLVDSTITQPASVTGT